MLSRGCFKNNRWGRDGRVKIERSAYLLKLNNTGVNLPEKSRKGGGM